MTFIIANSTLSPKASLKKSCILFREFMAIQTMSGVRPWAMAAINISFLGDRLKVIWVYAQAVFTKVINYKTIRNFSFMQFVRKSMGRISFFPNNILPINPICAGYPIPAIFCFFYFSPKSFIFHSGTLIDSAINVKDIL